jgi:HAMP domain-containing protein
MMVTRNFIVALTMAGGAAIAAALAVQRHSRQLERTRQKMDLQRWENETGNVLPPAAENPLP